MTFYIEEILSDDEGPREPPKVRLCCGAGNPPLLPLLQGRNPPLSAMVMHVEF